MIEALPERCIFVTLQDGGSRMIPLTDSMTVKDLQDYIIAGSGLPEDSLLLSFGKKNLLEKQKKLSQFGVGNLTNITCQVMGSKGNQIDFNKFENQTKGFFNSSAPDYRAIGKGLSFAALCSNKNCRAFNKVVLITKGFGEFNVSKEIYMCSCPVCKTETQQAFNIYYYKTKLQIKGKKVGQPIFAKTFTADDDQWHSFLEGNGQMCKWNFMEITAHKV